MISAGGAIENPTRVRELRRTIAQVLTVENEYKLGIRTAAKEPEKASQETQSSCSKETKGDKPRMKVTPDIIREEFIGTTGSVTSSPHAGYLGISGEVMGETRNTFTIQQEGKNEKRSEGSSSFPIPIFRWDSC